MNILVCDDDKEFLDFLSEELIKKYGNAHEFVFVKSKDEFLNRLNNYKKFFDVLIMDICLNDSNGIDLACFAQNKFPLLQTIFITGYGDKVEDIFIKIRPYAYVYGSIIVSIFIAIFYWTEMGIYISFKNKSKLYNSKLILILIPNIGWQLIINYLLINFFFETKVALNHTDMRDIFKGDSLGIVAFLTVIIAIIDIATVIFINNLNKSIFLDEQIDNTKVKSKTIEIYKGESNELSNNIRLLSESLNKTIHTFKQSSNIDCIELNKAINDFNNIKANQYSENSLIEAICVEKLGKLQESINITTQINIPQNISINDLDLCRIFCNLLDNALEAIHNSNQKKYLNIYAEYVDNKFTCLVENPSNSNLNKKNIISKRHQGLGLIILKDIAKKYNGKLTTKTYNGTFHTLIELILIEHPKTILLTE